MVLPRIAGDLYHKYRPQRFEELSGHAAIVKSIKNAIAAKDPPQSFLLCGESGTGKTSTARIIALAINCLDKGADGEPCLKCQPCKVILSGNCVDVVEKNAADHRGIDAIREIAGTMSSMGMQLQNKVYIFDEAHGLTKEAQSSMLKVLEEAPKGIFIILCTTHPEKLLLTVKNRCQIFKFKPLTRDDTIKLLTEVCTYEGVDIAPTTIEKIADVSHGTPRNALVYLQQVLQLDTRDEQEIATLLETEEAGGEDLYQFFSVFAKGATWLGIVEAYTEVQNMGAPALGMCLAGHFRKKLLACKNAELSWVYADLLELFVVPFDDGKLGENNLVLNLNKAFRLCRNLPAPYGKGAYGRA